MTFPSDRRLMRRIYPDLLRRDVRYNTGAFLFADIAAEGAIIIKNKQYWDKISTVTYQLTFYI
jgi:hypothetical protein